MKLSLRLLPWIGAAAVAAVLVTAMRAPKAEDPYKLPLILSKVQALGELRTARYTYEHIFEQTSSREPQEWARFVPGASSIVLASTRNSALASSSAQVDAGVDLRNARLSGRTIVLPKPTIYRPLIDTKLHQVRSGVFWRDDNLAQKANYAMEMRVLEAARRQGIIEEAERNVKSAIAKIAPESSVTFE